MGNPQIEFDDFVEIQKPALGSKKVVTPNLVRITSVYISLGKNVVQKIIDGGRYAKIAYSPKHQALMVTGTKDVNQGYILNVSPIGTASMGIPIPLQRLHAPRGDYLPLEGFENVYKLVESSKKK